MPHDSSIWGLSGSERQGRTACHYRRLSRIQHHSEQSSAKLHIRPRLSASCIKIEADPVSLSKPHRRHGPLVSFAPAPSILFWLACTAPVSHIISLFESSTSTGLGAELAATGSLFAVSAVSAASATFGLPQDFTANNSSSNGHRLPANCVRQAG